MSTPVLHRETCSDIQGYASSMLDYGLWKTGRSKAAQADHQRARDLCDLAHRLEVESSRARRTGLDSAPFDAALSSICLEIAALGRAALTHGLLKHGIYDPYVLQHPDRHDETMREALGETRH